MYDPFTLNLDVYHKSGFEYICLCPYHADKNPSASFNAKSGLFYCFACGQSANVYQLANRTNGFVTQTNTVRDVSDFDYKIWQPLLFNKPAYDSVYLKRRVPDITNDIVDLLQIKENREYVIFPFVNNNHYIGVQIRSKVNTGLRYLSFGQKPSLYGLSCLINPEPLKPVVLVEGVFGFLNFFTKHLPVLAVLGVGFKQEIVKYLADKDVLAIFDNDKAGLNGYLRILSLLPQTKIVLPGCEADELCKDDVVRLYDNFGQLKPVFNSELRKALNELA